MTSNQLFSFGKNWQKFIKLLDEDRIAQAEKSLLEFLDLKDFQDKSFLDIGCGSGLFSLAAYNLGAINIVSFDFDQYSVECCNYLHAKVGKPDNWRIFSGSILDDDFVHKLGAFDIVYSWGVLHCTGNMRQSIINSSKPVKKGGLYYIAVYNKAQGILGSNFWLTIKKVYNYSPRLIKYLLEYLYMSANMVKQLFKLQNPVAYVNNYKLKRGMDWKIDVSDWLGGYPYEFATAEEIEDFIRSNIPDFTLAKVKSTNGVGCNSFVYTRNNDSQ
ncbi:class I SAM-dependent methyltransferase [candidate division KSB1 bacterium]